MTTVRKLVRTALVVLALGGLGAGTLATLQPGATLLAGSSTGIVDPG